MRVSAAAAILRTCAVMIIVTVAMPHEARAQQQLNENCTVSVLNRSVRVNPDGSWVLPNVPANFGVVRARATCIVNGKTVSGESDLFAVPANGVVNHKPIVFGTTTPIPLSLTLSASATTITEPGAMVQLEAVAHYSDGSVKDVTAGSGTQYTTSNPGIATVSAGGLVQAPTGGTSGTVLVQATQEGASGLMSVQVALSGASHGGIPDSWAVANGLNPDDPVMPFEDPDRDGLTNLEEFQHGTDPHNPDVDEDGLKDGDEVNTYHTNPLVADTDGDGVPDGVEIQTATNPLNPASFDLSKALATFTVTPASFVLDFNTIVGVASQQLKVQGTLIDNKTTLDLTSTQKGTNYTSSDLNICNFGVPDGNVFAGDNGSCTITITNSGFTAQAVGVVKTFTPTALSFVSIPGFANGVAVNGDFAYVAAGSSGLQVVDVADRTHPTIAAALPLSGNANGIKLLGNLAYVASGPVLHAVDVTNPLMPVLRGTIAAGNALGVAVRGAIAYVANGSNLLLVNVANPGSMVPISMLSLSGTIQGVDVDSQRGLAVVAAGSSGVHVVNVSNPGMPVLIGSASTGDARAVAVQGNFAFVADYTNSTTSVEIPTPPSAPVVRSHIVDPNLGGFLLDIAVAGDFALGADVKFVNGVPITDISDPTQLQARAILNFPQRDDNGMGIAVDGNFVYLTADHGALDKFEAFGDSRLYIGQYLALVDTKGVPPTASIVSPADGTTVVEGSTLAVSVNAHDDVAVAGVNFLVNGTVAFTATSSPYQYNLKVPIGISSVTLGATAVDLGGNIGTAASVVVTVIPDPGTTVTGRVIDTSGAAVGGAIVSTFSSTATTAGDGTFAIPGVATVAGNIVVTASANINGTLLTGLSGSFAPVVGGTTDVGNIVVTLLRNGGFESGNLDGWTVAPGSSVQVKSSLGPAGMFTPIVPAEGQFMAVLSNFGSASTPPGTTGSIISQTFAAPAVPSEIYFCYQFVSNDSGPFEDFFLAQLVTGAGTFTLASADNRRGSPAGGGAPPSPLTVSPGTVLTPSSAPPFASGVNILGSSLYFIGSSTMTNRVCSSFTLPAQVLGTQVTLKFTSGNAIDSSVESAAVVDAVRIRGK